MINYFAILRIVNVRDKQTSRENFENSFRIRIIGTFRKKQNFENRTNIRDSSAV